MLVLMFCSRKSCSRSIATSPLVLSNHTYHITIRYRSGTNSIVKGISGPDPVPTRYHLFSKGFWGTGFRYRSGTSSIVKGISGTGSGTNPVPLIFKGNSGYRIPVPIRYQAHCQRDFGYRIRYRSSGTFRSAHI